MKSLIIAEKPSLGRAIVAAIQDESFEKKNGYYESENYIVASTVGHLYELLSELNAYFPDYDPKKKVSWKQSYDEGKLPFFPDGWNFIYRVKTDKNNQMAGPGSNKLAGMFKELLNRKDVDVIYNCGDPDREGQRLCDEIIEYNLKGTKKILRLWLPSLDGETIRNAIETAKGNSEYYNYSISAKARAEMDWLMGIELTRFASIKAGTFVRIGRCVCPIVIHVIEREHAIRDFVPVPYSVVSSKEKTNGEIIELTSKRTFENGKEKDAQALADAFNSDKAVVTSVKREVKTVPAAKLFSMSTLQGFACKIDKALTPADVLAATQKLYEAAYVSYPRTNSCYLTKNESGKVDDVIKALTSSGILGLTNKVSSSAIYDNKKVEAHSAIIPTGKIPAALSGIEKTVYDCILNRFCAVFCSQPCTVNRTTIIIHCADEDFALKGDVQKDIGWRKFEKSSAGDKMLPVLNQGDIVNIDFKLQGKMTTPPKRYTVEALNNWMLTPLRNAEKNDQEYSDEDWKNILSDVTICEESTRAETINHCVLSKYISLKNGTYYGEDAGFFLVDTLKSLGIDLDVAATVRLSKQLHDITEGIVRREDVLEGTKKMIDDVFARNANIASKYVQRSVNGYADAKPLCKCPKCGGNIVETPKAYACTGKATDSTRCSAILWKDNMYFKAIGKDFTKTMAINLFKNGKVALKGCTSKKTGKKYDCIVLCDFNGTRPELKMEFEHSGNGSGAGAVVGKCPFCGTKVLETKIGYTCSNKACNAVMWKKSKVFSNELDVSANKAKTLLGGGKVKFSVKSKEGKTYQADFVMNPHEAGNGKKYIDLIESR